MFDLKNFFAVSFKFETWTNLHLNYDAEITDYY